MLYKPRFIESRLSDFKKHFKIVLLLGARQVGKSTLLEYLFPDYKVVVFDPVQDLFNARQEPDLFLNTFPSKTILDEVQYVPQLLPSLKRKVDLSEEKGQYLLTGSQNLNVLKNASESLAGRVGILHLESMAYQELTGLGSSPSWIQAYLQDPQHFVRDIAGKKTNLDSLALHIWRGSMPGAIDLPDHLIQGYYSSYIQTYVERDVKQVENIRDMAEFDRFLGILGVLTSQEINASHLGREIGMSPPTSRKWLDILAKTYQWRELPPYVGNAVKRISGKHKGYLTDTGMACYLQKIFSHETLLRHPLLGAFFETWAVNEIHKQFSCLQLLPSCYHWRTAGGAEVDLIMEYNGNLYPIEIKCKSNISKHDLSGLKAFRETYRQQSIAPSLVIYAGNVAYRIDENTTALPWNFIM